jgi:hypothetical protein
MNNNNIISKNSSPHLEIGPYDELYPLRYSKIKPKSSLYNDATIYRSATYVPYDPLNPQASIPTKRLGKATTINNKVVTSDTSNPETNLESSPTIINQENTKPGINQRTIGIIIVIILIIVVIILIVSYFFVPKQSSTGVLPASVAAIVYQVNHESLWDDANVKSIPGPQGSCQFYNSTSYDYKVLSKIQPLSRSFTCLDYDLVYAKEVIHTCGSGAVVNGNKYPCYKQDGTLAKVGDTETFFKPCNLDYCKEQPTYIMFNEVTPSLCLTMPPLQTDGATRSSGPLSLTACTANNKDQLFRLSRAKWGGGLSSDGPLIKIQDRITGLCVKTDLQLATCNSIYDWIYYDGTSIPGSGSNCKGSETKSCPTDSTKSVDCSVAGPQQLVANSSNLILNPFNNVSNPICIVSKFNVMKLNGNQVSLSPFIYDTSCTSTSSDTSVCDAKRLDQKNKTTILAPQNTLSLLQYAKSITPSR